MTVPIWKTYSALLLRLVFVFLQLRQTARQDPETLAQTVIDPLIVKVLALSIKSNPQTMTIYSFWRLVARLGGFQGHKPAGDPDWRTNWRGWCFLSDLNDGVRLISNYGT